MHTTNKLKRPRLVRVGGEGVTLRFIVFIIFLAAFIILLAIEPLLAAPMFPSVLLSFWVFEDGMHIEELAEKMAILAKDED